MRYIYCNLPVTDYDVTIIIRVAVTLTGPNVLISHRTIGNAAGKNIKEAVANFKKLAGGKINVVFR